eukprot:GILJ01026368.1.p1 GENE.GILJ01026368.1~~GILJ01026368.1.p1  ORF type:complete len:125 (+),score=0.88 GILJ01026368.1:1-375(+)
MRSTIMYLFLFAQLTVQLGTSEGLPPAPKSGKGLRLNGQWDFRCLPGTNLTYCENNSGCNLFCNLDLPEQCEGNFVVCNVLPVGWPFCVTSPNCGGQGLVGGYAPHMYPTFASVLVSDLQADAP